MSHVMCQVVVGPVKLTVLRKGQFCVVVNPVDKKCVPQWGTREVRVGHTSFFLHPGEVLDSKGVQNAYILADNEMLLLQAEKQFIDDRNGEFSNKICCLVCVFRVFFKTDIVCELPSRH